MADVNNGLRGEKTERDVPLATRFALCKSPGALCVALDLWESEDKSGDQHPTKGITTAIVCAHKPLASLRGYTTGMARSWEVRKPSIWRIELTGKLVNQDFTG